MHGRQNVQVSGDYIYESKNAKQCFRVKGVEDSKFCQNFLEGPAKDCYDYSNWGENTELMYECLVAGIGAYNVRFSWQTYPNVKNLEYSAFCQNSSDLFGCVSLKNKQYCIFNKQYTKETFEELRRKIIVQMNTIPYRDSIGREYRYGEFFPSEISPSPYQSTEAYEFFPTTQEEAMKKGFVWYETKKQKYVTTLSKEKIPDHIKDIQDDILNKVIECTHKEKCQHECTGAFRVVGEELKFLRQFSLTLPRLCPNCRHYSRLVLRNPPKFFKRRCDCSGAKSAKGEYANTASHFHVDKPCSNEFETSYPPDRSEIVYCESCYQSEVA